jgi:tripartite-type tricarboxylate transporter receptor subunit TctC
MKVATRILALAAAAMFVGGVAQGASYPDHPVKIVVPFAPAGPTDVMARLIAQKLSESLKQQFYVENHPGAGGNIGMTQVAKSAPDGYTMLVASSSYVVNPSLYAKNPYDPFKDFAPVTLAAASPNILVVNADFPAKSVKELVELIKKEPGKYNYAMPGTGTTPHLAGCRPHADRLHRVAPDCAASAGRQIAWIGRNLSEAIVRLAGRSDHGGGRRRR